MAQLNRKIKRIAIVFFLKCSLSVQLEDFLAEHVQIKSLNSCTYHKSTWDRGKAKTSFFNSFFYLKIYYLTFFHLIQTNKANIKVTNNIIMQLSNGNYIIYSYLQTLAPLGLQSQPTCVFSLVYCDYKQYLHECYIKLWGGRTRAICSKHTTDFKLTTYSSFNLLPNVQFIHRLISQNTALSQCHNAQKRIA